MNPQIDTIVGIIIGASITGMVASGLWLWVCRQAGRPVLPIVDDDTPFRPLNDADLRLITICVACDRYQGDHRTLTAGQHLRVRHVTCPRCAKRAAVAAAPQPTQA